jgi:ATP-dependent helicase HrpA
MNKHAHRASDDPLASSLLEQLSECTARDAFKLDAVLHRLLRQGNRGESGRKQLQSIAQRIQRSKEMVQKRRNLLPPVQYPGHLPVSNRVEEIVRAIQEHQVLVLSGETGSGKSTQIPKMCLSAGRGLRGKIGCTQPRRVAAQSLSKRVAEELNVPLGREVGCKIRFQDESSPQSYIKFMTDGILLSELQNDPSLSDYDTLIIDEAHERSLNIDFILGHLRGLLESRPDLKLIITSATIDTRTFSEAFQNAPIIEVSGKLYPVEVLYRPMDEAMVEQGNLSYVDAAVDTVLEILGDNHRGDVLVFMPSERDIRETVDALGKQISGSVELMPLFGRLASGDQQKVFQSASKQRVIVATNIAETSLTLPGIRFVVDTGLARVSRYSPGTHTRRLPIEPIAQSNANQRKGRCGRVAEGICYRLYSEVDFEARPVFLPPEIQRCNLAEVILKMKAFHLGDMETFPFIQPPKPSAIKAGMQLLKELGALDVRNELTSLGSKLARLPLDPTIGRMILEAEKEGVVEEIVIIASGLSIQDPRERPMDAAEHADRAHRQFLHPKSDFLTLLNLWNAFHDEWERLKTQNQLRKFCRAHFLNYMRMREWRDIYRQIHSVLGDIRIRISPSFGEGNKAEDQRWYAAIHRSILSGLLSQSARRKDRNQYAGVSGRSLSLFPGSVLFERQDPKEAKAGKKKTKRKGGSEWIVSAEVVETSRTYARTNAAIQADWIVKLGAHLCLYSHLNPRWDRSSGRAVCTEVIRMGGVEIMARQVDFAQSNPDAAREIMIYEGLIRERHETQLTFLAENDRVLQSVEERLTRIRHGAFMNLEDLLFEFYHQRLPRDVASISGLQHHLRRHPEIADGLRMKAEDLLKDRVSGSDLSDYPNALQWGDHEIKVEYAYAPGETHDGITLILSPEAAASLQDFYLPWLIPGNRESVIQYLFKSLPKSKRRAIMPVQDRARAASVAVGSCGCHEYLTFLSDWLEDRFDLKVPEHEWDLGGLPDHLRPRLNIVSRKGKTVYQGKQLQQSEKAVLDHRKELQLETWEDACRKWERHDIHGWPSGDMPERVLVGRQGDQPLYAYPGLLSRDGMISVRLFSSRADAETATRLGWVALCEKDFDRELGWWRRDLAQSKALERARTYHVAMGSSECFAQDAYACLLGYLFETDNYLPLTSARYESVLSQARARIMGLWAEAVDLLNLTMESWHALAVHSDPYPGMKGDLASLFPARWLAHVPYVKLRHYPRYLKGMLVRCERAKSNAVKDREKTARLAPWLKRLNEVYGRLGVGDQRWKDWAQLRWMLEEYKVSLFAQELGTAEPVSEKRMAAILEKLEG